jgi:hypothetical protein
MLLLIVNFVFKILPTCLNIAIYQYLQSTIQLFQIWPNLYSELTSMRIFKIYSCNTENN